MARFASTGVDGRRRHAASALAPAPATRSGHHAHRRRIDALGGAQRLDAAIAKPGGTDCQLGAKLLDEAGLDGPVGATISNPFPFFRCLFHVHRMEATALGGTSSFPGPLPSALLNPGEPDPEAFTYEHRTSLGRDVYVRRSTWGWLSSGHRAVVTEIAERTIRSAHLLDFAGGGAETTSAAVETRAELVVPVPHLDLAALTGDTPRGAARCRSRR